jgi:hypothetical protein
VIFSDFAQLEKAIIASTVGDGTDLLVSGDADAAIFETMPTNCRVLHVVAGSTHKHEAQKPRKFDLNSIK